MGRFANEISNNVNNQINQWLLQNSFRVMTGPRGENGITRTYEVENGVYFVWVTINIEEMKIYVHKEYSCGGQAGEDLININKEWLISIETFVKYVDEELKRWIG